MLSDHGSAAVPSRKIDRDGKTLAQKKAEVQRAVSKTAATWTKPGKHAAGRAASKP